MRITTVEQASHWLETFGRLGEALMADLRLTNYGYSVHIEFTVIIDMRGRVLDDQLTVEFDFDGVEHLTLNGALTPTMLAHPEEINWGLSEVSSVRLTPSGDGVRFQARWEGERRVDIESRYLTLTVPSEMSPKSGDSNIAEI